MRPCFQRASYEDGLVTNVNGESSVGRRILATETYSSLCKCHRTRAVGIKIRSENTISTHAPVYRVLSTSLDVGWSPGQLCACKNRELIDESVWSRIQWEARELMLLWTRIRFRSNPPTNPNREPENLSLIDCRCCLKGNRNSERKREKWAGRRLTLIAFLSANP